MPKIWFSFSSLVPPFVKVGGLIIPKDSHTNNTVKGIFPSISRCPSNSDLDVGGSGRGKASTRVSFTPPSRFCKGYADALLTQISNQLDPFVHL
jgi:hypothetical protein